VPVAVVTASGVLATGIWTGILMRYAVLYTLLRNTCVSLITGLAVLVCMGAGTFAAAAGLPTAASINLCADQLLLLLAQEKQILSLSNLSHREAGSYYFEKARQYPVNKGDAENILNLNPDVVIVGQYSSVHTVNLLREVGLRVETLPLANDLETLFSNIQQVASWVDAQAEGDNIVRLLRDRLDQLDPPVTPQPVAAVYDPNGYTSGANSLRGQMMELAGWQNAASLVGIESYGKLTLEEIIRLSPDALIESPYSPGTYSRAQIMSQHPALLGAGLQPRVINVPSRMTVCAGPWTVDVIEQLQSVRKSLSADS